MYISHNLRIFSLVFFIILVGSSMLLLWYNTTSNLSNTNHERVSLILVFLYVIV